MVEYNPFDGNISVLLFSGKFPENHCSSEITYKQPQRFKFTSQLDSFLYVSWNKGPYKRYYKLFLLLR